MGSILEKARYLVLLAVAASLLASAATFVWGFSKAVLLVIAMAQAGGKDPRAAIALIELMDKFLLATGLYIFAVGMYELFFRELNLPKWLVVHNLHDIKTRLGSVVILVMAVTFLERLVEWQDPRGTLQFAIAIAVVSGALICFNVFGEKE